MAAADGDTPPTADGGGVLTDEALSSVEATPETATDLGQVDYFIVGHVAIDLYERRTLLGGSSTYSALTAQRLGRSVGVLTSADFEPLLMETLIGRDRFHEAAAPIRILRVPTQTTTCYVNQYTDDGRRQLLLDRAADLRPVHVPEEWRSASVVHLAPLNQEVDPALLDAFSGGLLLVTPQGWMRGWDEEGVVHAVPWAHAEAALARADVTIFSIDDLPDPNLRARYIERGRLVIVTENRRGCVVFERGKAPWRSHAFRPARESDPTGCGDVFAAAYAVQYQKTGDARVAADFANCVASFALEKRAWNSIPSPEAVADRLKRGKRRGA
jgi:sugar/nucleoside kinase (ribokinase family)